MGTPNPDLQHIYDQASRAVAGHCLLPDPRPHDMGSRIGQWFASWTRPINYLSEDRCIHREIIGKASLYHITEPAVGSHDYNLIVQHARDLAAAGARLCQVRDFNDTRDEPHHYVGYRARNGQCAVRIVP